MPVVERYGPGDVATRFDPGDFILTHRHNPMAGLISLAQKFRFKGPDAAYAHWSHCALIVDEGGALVEAESMGVTRSPISRYTGDEFHLVRLGSEFSAEGRKRAVDYTNAQVGQGFGFLAAFGAMIFLLTGLPLRLVRGNHQICSGLVVRALQKGNLLKGADPDMMLPADLAKLYEVRWSDEKGVGNGSPEAGDAATKP
ncbi:MAG TPA: hypothetical protein VIP78_07765 [Candidatus Dormibacteraeota bacterium]